MKKTMNEDLIDLSFKQLNKFQNSSKILKKITRTILNTKYYYSMFKENDRYILHEYSNRSETYWIGYLTTTYPKEHNPLDHLDIKIKGVSNYFIPHSVKGFSEVNGVSGCYYVDGTKVWIEDLLRIKLKIKIENL